MPWKSRCTGAYTAKETTEPPPIEHAELAKVSYIIGTQIARNFKTRDIEVNVDSVAQGIKDALAGGKLALTQAEVKASKFVVGVLFDRYPKIKPDRSHRGVVSQPQTERVTEIFFGHLGRWHKQPEVIEFDAPQAAP